MKTKVLIISLIVFLGFLLSIFTMYSSFKNNDNEEVIAYRKEHKYVLELKIEDSKISDQDEVQDALDSLSNLSEDSQKILEPEKNHLKGLASEIYRKIVLFEVQSFRDDNKVILGKTVLSIKLTHKSLLDNAIAHYQGLSIGAKNTLIIEKVLLDKLNAEIIRLEIIKAEVDKFIIDNASALELTIQTVQINDKDIIENAIIEHNLLSVDAKIKLQTEKALLDTLLNEIIRLESVIEEVNSFRIEHDIALSLTVLTVKISDKSTIEVAIAGYNSLSDNAKEMLILESGLLNSLISEVNLQESILFEVNLFKTNNAIALTLNTEIVSISDKVNIVKALEDFDLLNVLSKALLESGKLLLDSLLIEIERLENILLEVNNFLSSNSIVLGLTIETVDFSNQNIIDSALNDYQLLSNSAKIHLVLEKALIDNLHSELVKRTQVQTEITTFLDDNNIALQLTTLTVQINDRILIEVALFSYEQLSLEAKAQLSNEKAKLDLLLLEVQRLENIQLEIIVFLENNANVLPLEIENVIISDKTNIEQALSEYDTLSSEAKALLITEKTLLDNLLIEIERLEQILIDVAAFISNHNTVLSLSIETVVLANQGIIDSALNDYDLLDIGAKAKLTDEKALLDSLNNEIRITPLTPAQEALNYQLSHQTALSLTVGTITTSDQPYIDVALYAFELLSSDAKALLISEKALLDGLVEELDLQAIVLFEVLAFKLNYYEELSYTIYTVKIDDKAKIEYALTIYNGLSIGAKNQLIVEKTLLDNLLLEIIRLEDIQFNVSNYLTEHSTALSLTISTVNKNNLLIIEDALSDYDLFNINEKSLLLAEKELLNDLLKEINYLITLEQEILNFSLEHNVVLSLNISNVQISDKLLVEFAIDSFNLLSDEAKTQLLNEKALLDSLYFEIQKQYETEVNISTFKLENKDVLSLVVETVNINNKNLIELALAQYESLNDYEKAGLISEKALLDNLFNEVIKLEEIINQVSMFKSNNINALSLHIDLVSLNDKTIIENALADYNNLSDDAKVLLINEKASLDLLILQIHKLELIEIEVSTFRDAHKTTLDLSIITVNISDKSDIEYALQNYSLLSIEAKLILSNEKILLDSLLSELLGQEELTNEINFFLNNHSVALQITNSTLSISDKQHIELALASYESLSINAKIALTEEKSLLDNLILEVKKMELILQEVLNYKLQHSEALSKDISNINQIDRDTIEVALTAYSVLSDDAKIFLTLEKSILDDLILEIIRQESVLLEVATFKTDNSIVLLLTINTVTISDKALVENALVSYEALSTEAKALVINEKELLNNLLSIINHLDAIQLEISEFTIKYSDVLALTILDVVKSDKDNIEEAILAYNELDIDSKIQLVNEKSLLDSLLQEILKQMQLEQEITTFIEENSYVLSLTVEEVTIDDNVLLQFALDAFISLSTDAKSSLSTEKALLDTLELEIIKLENISLEINDYRSNHYSALSLTIHTLSVGDKAIIESALLAYNSLSIEAKNQLYIEKTLLDDLLLEINRLEAISLNVSAFLSTHATVLGLNTATVLPSNQAIIDAALDDYELLDIDAKAQLTMEKALLESLNDELRGVALTTAQIVSNYKLEHANALSLTVNSLNLEDKNYVVIALYAYELLSFDAKNLLLNEKELLDDLNAELNRLQDIQNEVNNYLLTHEFALTLNVETVLIGDKSIVNSAITQFESLSLNAKVLLISEKTLLDNLLLEIENLEMIQLEVSTFLNNHSTALSISINNVVPLDLSLIESAIASSILLSTEAKNILKTELELLSDLVEEIKILENIALEIYNFKANNSEALNLQIEVVKISDRNSIDLALSVYDLLSTQAKSQLNLEKTLLDNLIIEINRQELIQVEITNYLSNNSLALSLTLNSVSVDDLTIVETALLEYTSLSNEAKANLVPEKTLLDSLLSEIIRQNNVESEINSFKNNNAYVLSLSTLLVQISDYQLLQIAYSDFNNLSDSAKSGLAFEKSILDELSSKVDSLIQLEAEITKFLTEHYEALVITINNVKLSDSEVIILALAAYDNLSNEAKAELVTEKALLDSIQTELNNIEFIESAVLQFKNDHALVLSLNINTITISNQNLIDGALNAYQALDITVKAHLTNEKTLLDQLNDAIRVVPLTDLEIASMYQLDHATALSLTTLTVKISDENYVIIALEAYNPLSSEVKNLLVSEKALLDSLNDEIGRQYSVIDEVATFKTENGYVLLLNTSVVDITDKLLIDNAQNSYSTLSNDAKTILLSEKTLLDSLQSTINNLELIANNVTTFKNDHQIALGLNIQNVTISNKAIIESAISSYNLLGDYEKSQLLLEKVLLDSLLLEIAKQESIINEISDFRNNYSNILSKNVGNIEINDLSIIKLAISAFDLLSEEAKLALNIERTLLHDLLLEVNKMESILLEVSSFKTLHSSVLSLTNSNVEIANYTAITEALNAYNSLSNDAKSQLQVEKNHIDNLLLEITKLQAEEQLLQIQKGTIINAVLQGQFNGLIINEDSTAGRVIAVKAMITSLLNDPTLNITINTISEFEYQITLRHNDSKLSTQFNIKSSFIFSAELIKKIKVTEVQKILEDYYSKNLIVVREFSSPTKYNSFIEKSNYLIVNKGVTLTVKNVYHMPGNRPSAFEITLASNGYSHTFVVEVNYIQRNK